MQVFFHLPKLQHNIRIIRDACQQAGLQVVWVTKGCHSRHEIIDLLRTMQAEVIGDVHPANLKQIAHTFPGELMMVNLPPLSMIEATFPHVHTHVVSSLAHARAISAAAQKFAKRQRVMLLVDVGNLREGILPSDVSPMIEAMRRLPQLDVIGLGTTVGCHGGYIATERDMHRFMQIARTAERDTRTAFEVLSVGSGTMLFDVMRDGQMPARITQFRVGAAFLVGEKPPTHAAIAPLYQDCFIFQVEILELLKKPSVPAGEVGYDAFGKKVVFEDLGDRLKALLNVGMLDVDIYSLTPLFPGIRIIGGTSNYTICDVTDCREPLEVGQLLDFRMAYSAMAKATLSPYVKKIPITDADSLKQPGRMGL